MNIEAVSEFGERNKGYAACVYEVVAKSCATEKSFVLCPSSLVYHLAAIYLAAKGNLRSQIASTFRFGTEDVSRINKLLDTMTWSLHFHTMKNLYCAKKMYVDQEASIDGSYEKDVDQIFHISIEKANFENKRETTEKINDWVKEVTEENFTKLVDECNIPDKSQLMIVNALHFNGLWLKNFDVIKENFFIDENKSVLVDMITQIDNLHYFDSEILKAEFLKIPYDDDIWSLTVVLPHSTNTLSQLESDIEDVLRAANHDYVLRKIRIALPKFDVETALDLRSVLKNMGVTDVFDENETTFEGVTYRGSPVSIGSVIQKTHVGLLTAGLQNCDTNAIQDDALTLKVNRPFLFYIEVLNVVVFIGRYIAPSK